MRTCFGADINRAVMPAILKPLLTKPGLRGPSVMPGGSMGRNPVPPAVSVESG